MLEKKRTKHKPRNLTVSFNCLEMGMIFTLHSSWHLDKMEWMNAIFNEPIFVFKMTVTCRFQNMLLILFKQLSILKMQSCPTGYLVWQWKIMHSFFLLFILLFIHNLLYAPNLFKYLKMFLREILILYRFIWYSVEFLGILV